MLVTALGGGGNVRERCGLLRQHSLNLHLEQRGLAAKEIPCICSTMRQPDHHAYCNIVSQVFASVLLAVAEQSPEAEAEHGMERVS